MRRQQGFTLIEVMFAIGIIATTVFVLLERRLEVVRQAAEVRDERTAWMLLAETMAELELDEQVLQGEGHSGSGDYSRLGNEYNDYSYTYELVVEEVPTNIREEEEPSEIYRLTVRLHWIAEEAEKELSLTGYFPLGGEAPR